MDPERERKADLQRRLRYHRDALLWKLDGLCERELREPRTATGTTLLGIVKHMANVEIGYFGDAFGRAWDGERVPEAEFDADPQADWYATEAESASAVVALYRRVWEFADGTIALLPLDAPGVVPWWPPERNRVTLEQVCMHVLVDLVRHVGQADILREEIDGAVGLNPAATNIPDGYDWRGYREKLFRIAQTFDAPDRGASGPLA